MTQRSGLRLAAGVLVLAATAHLPEARAATCSTAHRPGATLLFPYFEADLGDPAGRDTLISVNNADAEPVLAHVVVWTDVGLATLAFDLYLDAHAVRTVSLRRVLAEGRIPPTGDERTRLYFPGCTSPLAVSELDAAALAELRARHTGAPDPTDGLCYAAPSAEPGLAVGYVTVDAFRDCSGELVYPFQAGYFDTPVFPGGVPEIPGLASERNVLWGDAVLLDSRRDSAQGFAAAALRYDDELTEPTFFAFWSDVSMGFDSRRPVGDRYRSRFMNGGAFDGGTDIVTWHQGPIPAIEPFACGELPTGVELQFRFTNEAGEVLAEHREHVGRRTARRRVGGDLPAPSPFGFVEISGRRLFPAVTIPFYEDVRAVVVPLLSSDDRFSVAVAGSELRGPCPETPTSSTSGVHLAFATDFDALYEMDLDHGTYRTLTPSPGPGHFTQIDVADDGRLFGLVTTDPIGIQVLVSVDPTNVEDYFERVMRPSAASLVLGPGGDLWALSGRELRRLDPETGNLRAALSLDDEVLLMAADGEELFGWRRSESGYTLSRIDPTTGALEPRWFLDLGGDQLLASDFDLDGNLRLMTALDTPEVYVQRFYRVDLDPSAGLPVRAELTSENVLDHRRPDALKPAFFTLATRPAVDRGSAGGTRPAASMLVPYFEVDLENRDGPTTLFSVHNAGAEPVLANVVLWTDWGIASLAFHVFLEAGAGRVFDLRRIFADGRLPELDPAVVELYPGCESEVGPAAIDRADLAARHTGKPLPADGLCRSAPRGDATLAVGYVTVDVVNECSAAIRSPADPGYFGDEGLAGGENVLSGEVFLIDQGEDFAQGFAAVPVSADPDRAAGSPSFYSRGDDRASLGCAWRTRFFEGGVFEGGTELLVWSSRSPVFGKPAACDAAPACPLHLSVRSRPEAGGLEAELAELESDRQTRRLAVGGETLPVAGRFGSLDVRSFFTVYDCEIPFAPLENVQTWVVPLTSARGRFSVALEATDLGGVCN